MRKGGIKLVLITGARVSTLLQRMAYLPAADAYICENGGRIFYPGSSLPLALPVTEDMQWRHKHNATGTFQFLCMSCTFCFPHAIWSSEAELHTCVPLVGPSSHQMTPRASSRQVHSYVCLSRLCAVLSDKCWQCTAQALNL